MAHQLDEVARQTTQARLLQPKVASASALSTAQATPITRDLPRGVCRPSLAYRYALDTSVTAATRTGSPVGLVCSSRFYLHELSGRLGSRGVLLSNPADGATDAALDGPRHWRALLDEDGSFLPRRISAVVWAEPERLSAELRLAALTPMLPPGASLCVVSSGWLARRLPEWRRTDGRPATRPLGPGETAALLREHGFVLKAAYGFQGPRSIGLGLLGRAFERLDRPELADRCEALMRAAYLETGVVGAVASVRLLIAERQPVRRRSAGRG